VRLLCPNQRRLANPWRCWNWFHPLAQRGQGELLAVLRMIDDCAERVRVSPTAIAAVGISAGGAMAALLGFHHAERVRAAIAVAAPPLVGEFGGLRVRDVLHGGLRAAPESALGAVRGACAPLAVIHGMADETVHPRCGEQLVDQALASCRRNGLAVQQLANAGADTAGITQTDYAVGDLLRVRRIDIDGLGHLWSGATGGHPYCVVDGPPLTALCERFLRDAGVLSGADALPAPA
jgi:poly(3-hydroxybutyrate) depolymerase